MNNFRLESSVSNTENTISSTSLNATSSMIGNDIFQLARAFLAIEPMTHKKLQKLCYYAKAWYLAINDENLVPEHFEAWVHGAVQPDLYRKYRNYGFEKIPKEKYIADIPETFMDFAKDVFEVYGGYTGDQLEYINHQEEPWIKARCNRKPWEACNNIISEEDMKNYYRTRMLN